jgi:hypothetical protein
MAVGKFDNVGGALLPFSRLTVIYAENGRGKTTLAAILRSPASGLAGPILERARLGAPHPPHVVIDLDGGRAAVFQNGAWTRTAPEITIFDDSFVAANVCSGIEVAAFHRQNLHELVVGAQGTPLSQTGTCGAAPSGVIELVEMCPRGAPCHRRFRRIDPIRACERALLIGVGRDAF